MTIIESDIQVKRGHSEKMTNLKKLFIQLKMISTTISLSTGIQLRCSDIPDAENTYAYNNFGTYCNNMALVSFYPKPLSHTARQSNHCEEKNARNPVGS
jgi:hypothetical protein